MRGNCCAESPCVVRIGFHPLKLTLIVRIETPVELKTERASDDALRHISKMEGQFLPVQLDDFSVETKEDTLSCSVHF